MDDNVTTVSATVPDELKSFVTAYRDTLQPQYDTAVNELNQQRKNDYQTLMSQANAAGMLHSNFPAREKIKYDTQTYQPNLIKLRQSYQTGVDTLRENVVKTANQIKSLQEKIADLNEI